MRNAIVVLVLAVVTAGCTWDADDPTAAAAARLEVHPTPSSFSRITAGSVRALVPEEWRAVPMRSEHMARQGFVASPRPGSWGSMDRGTAGLSATWVDASRVGVPSDYYYLAATGPLLSRLSATRCRTLDQRVFVDNAPAFATGVEGSPGDYVARGEGRCRERGGEATRWAYFVAAPGFGPTRTVGIPSSGLYVVVATAPEGPEADGMLAHLLAHTRFGNAAIADFVRAIRGTGPIV